MDAPATLVWMAPGPPDAEQLRALSSFSRTHGVRLAAPRPNPSPALDVDLKVADAVEAELDRAREAIAAGDGDAADRALSSAGALLWAHAELPQAAWLMAEVERASATRWRRAIPPDPEAAERSWTRAEALDGGRVAGVGEEASARHPPGAAVALEPTPGGGRPWLDGAPVAPGTIVTRAGPHSLVVRRASAAVWAGWIDVPPGSSTVRIVSAVGPPCSDADVSQARLATDWSADAGHVVCPAWLAAAAGEGVGAVRVAFCETDHCGAWLEWRVPPRWTGSPPTPPERQPPASRSWPAGATWSVLGAGAAIAAIAAIATGVVLVASGALQPAPSETRFVSGGVRSP